VIWSETGYNRQRRLRYISWKIVAQACHASVAGYKYESQYGDDQAHGAEMKVVLHAGDETVRELGKQAKSKGIPAQFIRDAGRNEVRRSGSVETLFTSCGFV
jgi:peptidyl-tRNA hydrolase